jgi:hypothetical protein
MVTKKVAVAKAKFVTDKMKKEKKVIKKNLKIRKRKILGKP